VISVKINPLRERISAMESHSLCFWNLQGENVDRDAEACYVIESPTGQRGPRVFAKQAVLQSGLLTKATRMSQELLSLLTLPTHLSPRSSNAAGLCMDEFKTAQG
jgi:hypothetical protein